MANFITVGTYDNPIQAHLARGRLEVEGIPAYVAHEHHIWAIWMYSLALGGVKVQVLEENAELAIKIINAHDQGEYEDSLTEEQQEQAKEQDVEVKVEVEQTICQKCHSNNYQSEIPTSKLLLVILSLGLIGIIFPIRKNQHTCNNCGHKWKY
jgi:hypothetical protein